MKLLFALLLLVSFKSFGQITIREENTGEKIVQKPKAYDSLVNISYQKKAIDFYQFIGQTLYYIPKSKKYESKFKKTMDDSLTENFYYKNKVPVKKIPTYSYEQLNPGIGTKAGKNKYLNSAMDSTYIYAPSFEQYRVFGATEMTGIFHTKRAALEGKYFTILDVVLKNSIDPKDLASKKTDVKLGDVDGGVNNIYLFKLKDNVSKDTILWKVRRDDGIQHRPFILVSFFTKLKKLYSSNNVIAEWDLNGFTDINTGNTVYIKQNDKWMCTDFSFVDTKDNFELVPYFFLKNTKGEEIRVTVDDMIEKGRFITEKDFNAREIIKRQKLEDLKKEEIAKQAKIAKDHEESRRTLVKMFGEKYGNLVNDSRVVIGMTKEMCEMSWGSPIVVNTIKSKESVIEQWVYSRGNYLYFKGNTLVIIQN
ncbi:Uncharacterised protein [Chryseobacterium nakagawai]|uniref:GLPGLI family protein n=1 Tax=Chryseobacterium nakagawai TaxID=1241982 RepID=A0AAD0YIX8_CHRNA|nr:hypothetical protein [Chryseobacterium nakagawai]AZA89905.1 hypothetical protein EG343_04325 [Chryseobacterium nakagawai]VEH21318.1 Uncharacterised protein [Chryseobacterium nakagawai]